MTTGLAGKVVLITGGSRGQGAAEAEAFAKAGSRVIIADVLDEAGRDTAARLRSAGGDVVYRPLDVSIEKQWSAIIDDIRKEYGSLHALVNNAGVTFRSPSMIETPAEDWHRVLGINLTGPFFGIRASAPLIRDSGGGAIVNTGSIAGLVGHFATAYSVSKWGLRGLTKAAAFEFAGWNIRVNAIHPGLVETEMVTRTQDFREAMQWMTPLHRGAEPSEIASAVVFLASDDARFITGVDLAIDGGFVEAAAYRKVLERVQSRPNSSL